ncbi:hypothetical protein JCM19379_17470 [Methyloparacoccus murrellii]
MATGLSFLVDPVDRIVARDAVVGLHPAFEQVGIGQPPQLGAGFPDPGGLGPGQIGAKYLPAVLRVSSEDREGVVMSGLQQPDNVLGKGFLPLCTGGFLRVW